MFQRTYKILFTLWSISALFRTQYTSRILSNDLKLISTREYVAQTDSKLSLLGHKVTTLFGIHKWEINCKYLLTFNVKYFLIFYAFYAFLYARIFQKRFLPRVRLRNILREFLFRDGLAFETRKNEFYAFDWRTPLRIPRMNIGVKAIGRACSTWEVLSSFGVQCTATNSTIVNRRLKRTIASSRFIRSSARRMLNSWR